MADEQSQRPYRASEPPLRGHARASNDPLAELARLIGQADPFGEFGRDTARRPAASVERADWSTQTPNSPYAPQGETDWRASTSPRPESDACYHARGGVGDQAGPIDYDDQNYGRESHVSGQATTRDDLHQADPEARGYAPGQNDYQYDSYEQGAPQLENEYYDEVPSSRRRVGVMAIAGVFALALIGTAGAFGYRALFGSSGSPQPPPVIKADTGPSKIVPAASGKDTQSNKLITERVNDRGQSEKLVSREEQPIDKPTTVVLSQVAPQQSSLGSGVVGSEPKKVRTIAIRPDQSGDVAPAAAPLATTAAARAPQASSAPAKPSAMPARPPENLTADADSDSTPTPVTRSASPARAPSSGNSPLSLSPDASPARAQARPTPPTQTAAVAPQASAPAVASSNGGGGSFVQISSQRSEAEAQAAFRGLQAKFPTQLGGRELLVHKADLGAKGTYYRAMVGPFANPGEAAELCSSLKAAGGQCLVQRN